MKFKNKKRSLFFTIFSAVAVGGTAVSLALTLTSCNSEKTDTNLIIPTANQSTFTNLNDSLTPVLASVLSSKEGRESVVDTAANKILSSWFENIENPTLNADYTEWQNSAEKSYEDKLKDYKDNKGSNWKKLFQIEVLDPVGGTKEAYIENQINQNLQSTFISNLFAKNYEGVAVQNTPSKQETANTDPMQNRTIYSINTGSGSIVDNAQNINGLSGPGTKNAFVFSAETITDANRQSVDYGYADFMEFLMDSWVRNELPLPISMSLWKNAENPTKSGLFDTDYFTNISDSGSYNFQYFTPSSPNNQVMTTTDKYKFLVKELQQGKFVDTTTGAINLPKDMTEDSSTTMTITADNLFDGSIATPFSAAAWYKFSNELFGITDSAMGSANALDSDSIMGNFLVDNLSPQVQNSRNFSTSKTGIFAFPYLESETKASGAADSNFTPFKGEYANAKGVVDTVNITSNGGAAAQKDASVESNFIITRDSFGVHLIGIDRLSQMKAAVQAVSKNKSLTSTEQTISKYNAVTTEIRNTYMWRAAQDIVKNESNYKLQDTLKTYLQDNFSKLIVEYASKALLDSSNTSNNLFGQKVMTGTAKPSTNNGKNDSTSDTGEESSTNQNYNKFKEVLEILDKTNLINFITSNNQLDVAERSLKFVNNVKEKMYANQSNYSNTTNYEEWKNYGIAGVPPYTRDPKTGNFTSLISLVNQLVQSVKAPSTSNNVANSNTRNSVNDDSSQTVAVDTTALGQNSSNLGTIDNAYKFVLASKLQLMQNISKLLNEGSTHTPSSGQVNPVKYNTDNSSYLAQPSYIFTNDDYVNNAIEAVSKAGKLADIIQNLYTQNYLTNQTQIDNSSRKKSSSNLSTRAASEEFYDFRNNKIDVGDSREVRDNSETSTDTIKKNIQDAIDSNYLINNFKNLPNLYSDGDWNELEATSQSTSAKSDSNSNGVINIAKQAWTKSWITSQYTYNVGGQLVVAYEDPGVSSSYQKFLVTLEYLFDYSPENGGTFTFGNLKNFLDEITENNNRAMVAWIANNTIKQDSSGNTFGVMGKDSSITNQDTLRQEVMKDYQFQGNPVYLDKLTPYSWYNAPNVFTTSSTGKESLSSASTSSSSGITQDSINWTNSSNYWNTASMQKNQNGKQASTPNTGFLGFQVDNASNFGMTNSITSDAFKNSTYTISASIYPLQANAQNAANNDSFAYVGTLYQYGGVDSGRQNLIGLVQKMSTINQLVDFYNNVLVNSNLPITNESKTEITNIINSPSSNQTDKIANLSAAIIKVINDETQIPDQAFQRLDALPLWNSNTFGTSTLFADGDGGALYNQYVVTMFNNEDVKKLTTDTDGKVTINDTSNGGFLGLSQDAFYSAVIMLAANNTQLQDDAMKAMLSKIGKISVYDQRIATSLNSSWIYNYNEWETLLDKLSSSN